MRGEILRALDRILALSASLMVVLIATLAGITDLTALIAVAGVNAAMNLFGLVMVSLFVFFNSFAVNMWLQYRRVGPWRPQSTAAWLTLARIS